MLSPEEIHRLATKTRKGVAEEGEKAPCHSDLTSSDRAQAIQAVKIDGESQQLDPVTLEPIERAGGSPPSA